MNRSVQATLAAGLVLAGFGFWGARSVATAPSRALARADAALELRVPHARGSIVLDGDLDDPGWAGPVARTGQFVRGNGALGKPYSDARLTWADGHLYVALYAADEDIKATHVDADGPLWLDDAFHLSFVSGGRERSFDVSPLGVLTDGDRASGTTGPFDYAWQSGAHVSRELDGTLNDPRDDDEEWVVELAIPLESLGLTGARGERVGFAIHRCDTPHDGRRVCAAWGTAAGEAGGVIVLD